MANQTIDDEIFEFSNSEFTREDLITALNEMVHEYRKLSQTFEEIKAENGCKIHETQKPLNDKSGLASVIHDAYESVKYDDQTTGQLNHKGKTGIGYFKPENSKPSWLTNRLEKDKAKAGPNFNIAIQLSSELNFRLEQEPCSQELAGQILTSTVQPILNSIQFMRACVRSGAFKDMFTQWDHAFCFL
ncbi:hypothetical protein F511_23452 [Dorcoceras hygrometricum]|uniref:Uncharacterized protein n=1 Tax=Dorcoceras hygrometricum TaxID=472368 RepID=A0A2Z7C0F0_9LAMI|nr:hypothetical protein F511_23452 [Dorcoceras hygrometricum]